MTFNRGYIEKDGWGTTDTLEDDASGALSGDKNTESATISNADLEKVNKDWKSIPNISR